jgi:hypothetical protein
MTSKSAKPAPKPRQPHNDLRGDKDSIRSGRDRRPSDKIAAQREFFKYRFYNILKL